ncbi:MAG: hypothetical protein K6E11_02095 [Bacilli bacterium]|nr:hypothetical protein [Bacilli bacterium]
MAEFFKTLLKGVIYVVLLPFILLVWVLSAIYCVFIFLYSAIKNMIIFFAGGNPMGDLPEDVKAKKILTERLIQPQPSFIPTAAAPTPAVSVEGSPAPTAESLRPTFVTETSDEVLNRQEEQDQGGDDDGNFTQTY